MSVSELLFVTGGNTKCRIKLPDDSGVTTVYEGETASIIGEMQSKRIPSFAVDSIRITANGELEICVHKGV